MSVRAIFYYSFKFWCRFIIVVSAKTKNNFGDQSFRRPGELWCEYFDILFNLLFGIYSLVVNLSFLNGSNSPYIMRYQQILSLKYDAHFKSNIIWHNLWCLSVKLYTVGNLSHMEFEQNLLRWCIIHACLSTRANVTEYSVTTLEMPIFRLQLIPFYCL